jgi:hypothetical protein
MVRRCACEWSACQFMPVTRYPFWYDLSHPAPAGLQLKPLSQLHAGTGFCLQVLPFG